MTVFDMRSDEIPPGTTMQLADSIHVREEPDGSALVIDDRTLTAARLNKAAYVLLQALHQPRTLGELVSILAEAAHCHVSESAAPVVKLVQEISHLGWVEFHPDDDEPGGSAPSLTAARQGETR